MTDAPDRMRLAERTLRQRARLAYRKLKRLLEFLFYGLFDTFVLAGKPRMRAGTQGVAVVLVKRVGDYFLWLPYGRLLAEALAARGEKMHFVANREWAMRVPVDFPDAVVHPIDVEQLTRNLGYRAKILHALCRLEVRETILAIYPRAIGIVDDALVRALGGWTVGFDAVFPDRPWLDRVMSRRLYRHLLEPLPGVHQHVRYRRLVEACGVRFTGPPQLTPIRHDPDLRRMEYFVMAPGASRTARCWPPERFTMLARRILAEEPGWTAVVVGSAAEAPVGHLIAAGLGGQVQNRTGATNLDTFIELIRGARLVLGNDSAAGHIAAWYGVPAVIAVGGMDFGRCYPYEDSGIAPVARLPRAISTWMDCFYCEGICRYRVRPGQAAPCLEAIEVESMWEAVRSILADIRAHPQDP